MRLVLHGQELKAACWLGEVAARGGGCYDSEFYHWPTLLKRANQCPDLPKLWRATVLAQGLLHDACFYGRDAKQLVPTAVSHGVLDGAILSGSCVVGARPRPITTLNSTFASSRPLWAKHASGTELRGHHSELRYFWTSSSGTP